MNPEIFVIIIGLIVCAFAAGYDHELDKMDQASREDRMRVYCSQLHHNEAVCIGVKQND